MVIAEAVNKTTMLHTAEYLSNLCLFDPWEPEILFSIFNDQHIK